MNKHHICFVTTGDIGRIATAKRALGMANPLAELGWKVSIIMEDTDENRHRTQMECGDAINMYFFKGGSAKEEIAAKNKIIKDIDPDYIYYCAFVTRNIVGRGHRAKKLIEHSELQTGIPDMRGLNKIKAYFTEFYSIIFSDGLLLASRYLEKVFEHRCRIMLHPNRKCLYFPYAYPENTLELMDIDRSTPKFSEYKGRKIITFLGTIIRSYGVFTIIEAVEKVKSLHPEILLIMYGHGHNLEEARQYVKSHKLERWVRLPGFIAEEDISKCFSLTDYFISPMNDTVQDWARCPSKLYMYLPYRKPIITCKIGEPFETLGNAGVYYEPSNSTSLASAITHLLESGVTTLDIDPKKHSWKTRTKEFDKWIRETFEKKNL